jgi:NADH-quinone oxidoreductase subunit N
LLAYSAVAHSGYTLLGLVAGGREGFAATLFYTTVYAFTLVGAFGVVGLVGRETGGDDFKNFAGLWSRSPLLSGCMAIFMLSLAGLPPLAGFFGKFYLFSAALRSGGNHGLLWLVALALLGSFVSLYYYLAVLKAIFVEPVLSEVERTNPPSLSPIELDFLQRISLVLLAGTVLVLGLLPGGLVTLIAASLAPLR